MKKLLAIVLAALMIAACSVTAFAETTNVSYNVDPSYTVSIPAAVTLGDSAVEADITASDVIMEDGKQIKVELTSASNTASGSTFNAKNGDSTVTYTITGDEAIAVGDTVATFTANGSKTLTFSAADKSAATVAGTHTETLTFGISVENATKTLTLTGEYWDWNAEPPRVTKSLEIEYTDSDTWKDIAERYDEVSLVDNPYGPSEGKIVQFWYDEIKGIDGCELKSNQSTYNYNLVSINDKVSAYSSYYLED